MAHALEIPTFLKRDKSAAKSVDTPLSNIPSTPQPAIKSSKAAARDEAAKPSKGKPVTKVAEGVGGNVKLLKPKTAPKSATSKPKAAKP